MASADSCRLSPISRWGLPFARPGRRSPQVRTLTFPAPLPHLPHQPLIASGLAAACQLARLIWPHMGFVFLRLQVCLRLPPDPASRRRPCLQLAVGATLAPLRGAVRVNLRSGLSPPSQRPCWAHKPGHRVLRKTRCPASPLSVQIPPSPQKWLWYRQSFVPYFASCF
jgi:hypothetical protein